MNGPTTASGKRTTTSKRSTDDWADDRDGGTDRRPRRTTGPTTATDERTDDRDGDGVYRDVDADGTLTSGDVTTFFENQHAPVWNVRDDLFRIPVRLRRIEEWIDTSLGQKSF